MVDFTKLIEVPVPGDGERLGFVYFLFYKEVLVYIGKTGSLNNRLFTHKAAKIFDRVLVEQVSLSVMSKREAELLRHYNPPMNEVAGVSGPKYTIIDDCLFMRDEKRACRIKDGELVPSASNNIFGRCMDGKLCFVRTTLQVSIVVKYLFDRDEKNEQVLMQKGDFYFDKESFSIKFKEKAPYSTIEPPAKMSATDKRDLLRRLRNNT